MTKHAHAAFHDAGVRSIGAARRMSTAMSRLSDPRLLREFAFIDGAWRSASSGATIAVTDPATGETLGHVPNLGAAETREAIAAAEAAFAPGARCCRKSARKSCAPGTISSWRTAKTSRS